MVAGGSTDAELLAAHLAGDRHAFSTLVGRYTDQLWGVAVRTLARHDDAADVVQEALVAAYRRAASYRGDSTVRTWLHRIVVNTCIDRIRYDGLRRTVPLPAPEVLAERVDHESELVTRMSVDAALARLPVEQRVAVVLVDVQGWPVADAAVVLGIPVGTVKSRCARGRAKLAVLLGHLREEV
ncbi:RNA polymerase sigma factor SigM [Pseudonocardia sp. TRM90224]|uniref:RNA polymerase sigma factor SigM n=1 Tax=Pseudonocardia sp. TRM90224 TaxID=2812678 RepID=UPI001E29C664|nr:RNA polymerase sigma factor SigM [Pseudonocardia sp. TRM90224]